MRQPVLVLSAADSPNRFAGYLEELLRMEGLTCIAVVDHSGLQDAAARPSAPPLVIVPAVYIAPGTAEVLATYVRSGGNLCAARPAATVTHALGLPPPRPLPAGWASRYVVLDGASGVTAGLPWADAGVQFLGAPVALVPEPSHGADAQPGVAAWLAPFPGQRSPYPAVVTARVGAGRVALFAFDPAESAVRQHQGRPEQASTASLPDFDGDGTFRPNDLFVGQLDPALRDVPQADLQRTLLLRVIEWLTEARPLPRLWRFPGNAPAAALIDGDSDAMTLDDLWHALGICDRFAAPFATYLKPEHIELLDPAEHSAARARGHRFGPHPWAGPRPSVEELRDALEADCAAFAARYGYRPRIHRGHWLVWPGWAEHARSLQAAGIELDANFAAGWGFKGGYVNGTGLPARFVDGDGRLLDVYEQSTISTDDGWLTPKAGLPALTLAEAISRSCAMIDAAVDRYHTVYHPYFHPKPLQGGGAIPYPTRPWLEAVLAHVRRRGIPFLDAERWLDWLAARRRVTLTTLGHEAGRTTITVRCPTAVEDVTILVPVPPGSRPAIAVDGAPIPDEAATATRHGRLYARATLTLRANEARTIELRRS